MFHMLQILLTERTHPDSTNEGDFKKLSHAEISALVRIVFSSSFIRVTKEIKYYNKISDINFELERSFIKFEGKAPDSNNNAERAEGGEALEETAPLIRARKKPVLSAVCCKNPATNSLRIDSKKVEEVINEPRNEDLQIFVDVIEVTASVGTGRTPVKYALGRSYDNQKSVFLFKKSPQGRGVVLLGYLFNVAILK